MPNKGALRSLATEGSGNESDQDCPMHSDVVLEPARGAWWAPKSWLRSETLVLELLIRSFSPVLDLALAKRKYHQNTGSRNLNSASKLDPKPSQPTRVSPSPPRTRFWTFL